MNVCTGNQNNGTETTKTGGGEDKNVASEMTTVIATETDTSEEMTSTVNDRIRPPGRLIIFCTTISKFVSELLPRVVIREDAFNKNSDFTTTDISFTPVPYYSP